RASLRFVDMREPRRSPLLRKAGGEMGHGGGAVFSATAKAYDRLLYFALGATAKNLPPDAFARDRVRGSVGSEIRLDGSLSGDPDDDEVAYEWRVVDGPPGHDAALRGADGETAVFVPDRPGRYQVELKVHDGKLWSMPVRVAVEVPRTPDWTAGAAHDPPPRAGTDRADAAPIERDPLRSARVRPDRVRLLRRLCYDVLQRGPRVSELRAWLPLSHEETVDTLLRGDEAWLTWYEDQLYYFLLLDRFRPKEGPLTKLPRKLSMDQISVPRAVETIVRSQFFNARNPGNDTFITVVLEQCMGMTVQERRNVRTLELGKKMYDGYRTRIWREEGDSQADFVRIVFGQRGAFEHLIRRSYRSFLGSRIDKKQLKAEAQRLQQDPMAFKAMLRDWLVSPEYVAGAERPREKTEIPFVRALFVDLLDRLPTYDELRNVRNAFLSLADPTPLRLVVGRVLLESNEMVVPDSAIEPRRFVREQFLRLLGRPPADEELEIYIEALRSDPKVTARLVIWALVSSVEYQTY
ncbi:MAG: PKD domain-containing protein, partial [Planctomycetota bacterium]